MVDIVKKTIDFYIKNGNKPELSDIGVNPSDEKKCLFVTLYYKWEVRWSSGSIKEILDSKEQEVIENTVCAISSDDRFQPLGINETKDVKIRVDSIDSRRVLWDWELQSVEPVKSWVIAIKNDYKKMAVILPNIHPSIIVWKDFEEALWYKLWEKFEEKNYIVYEIKTIIEKDF